MCLRVTRRFPRHFQSIFSEAAMKKLVTKLLLLAFIFPTFAQVSIRKMVAQVKEQAQANGGASIEARIKRVEQGLLPEVQIKGDPSWSIEERMKFYKVPGLTIAVIKDFKVDWARAYGV